MLPLVVSCVGASSLQSVERLVGSVLVRSPPLVRFVSSCLVQNVVWHAERSESTLLMPRVCATSLQLVEHGQKVCICWPLVWHHQAANSAVLVLQIKQACQALSNYVAKKVGERNTAIEGKARKVLVSCCNVLLPHLASIQKRFRLQWKQLAAWGCVAVVVLSLALYRSSWGLATSVTDYVGLVWYFEWGKLGVCL